MIKIIGQIRRKPGSTHEAFRDYYEKHHAPLAAQYISQFLVSYERNFIAETHDYAAISRGEVSTLEGFDCLTEMTLENRAALDGMMACLAQPDVRALIEADEEKFIDRSATVAMICEQFGKTEL